MKISKKIQAKYEIFLPKLLTITFFFFMMFGTSCVVVTVKVSESHCYKCRMNRMFCFIGYFGTLRLMSSLSCNGFGKYAEELVVCAS